MRRRPGLLGVAIAVLLVAGCAAIPTSIGTVDDASVSTPVPSESVPAEETVTGLAPPDDFPRGDIPLVAGEIVAVQDFGTGWGITFAADDQVATYERALGLLVDAGFDLVSDQSNDVAASGQARNTGYTVTLTAAETPGLGKVLAYAISLN